MSSTRLTALCAAALLTGALSASANAQKAHTENPHPAPAPHPMSPPHIEHRKSDDAKLARHEDEHAAEQMRQDDKHMADRAREERALHEVPKRPQPETKAEKALDRTEHRAVKAAREEANMSVRGLRLSSAERTQIHAIDKKYDAQLKALEAQDRADEKAGRPDDPTLIAKINALRDQERAEIRASLSAAHQAQFDRNLTLRPR